MGIAKTHELIFSSLLKRCKKSSASVLVDLLCSQNSVENLPVLYLGEGSLTGDARRLTELS